MIIEVSGVQYSGWTEASAAIRLDALSNVFEFNATSQDGTELPFKGGEACKILADDELIITGHIEQIDVDGDSESHNISIKGRDKTGDVLDSKIAELSDIVPPISLKTAIEKVLEHIGSQVKVISIYSPSIFESVEDLIAPEPGQDVWEFIQRLARKKQVLLSSNKDGDITITKSSGTEIDASLKHIPESDENNVLQYSVSYDTTGRYNVYKVISQLNPISLLGIPEIDNANIVKQNSVISDSEIRSGRQFAIVAENSTSSPIDRATWEANIRKARGKVYSATVNGYKNQTGKLWAINEIIRVKDDFVGIDSRMLINSVEFSLGASGKQTVLSLVHKDAYTLELSEPESEEQELGIGLTLS